MQERARGVKAAAVLLWLACTGTALAQSPDPAEPSPSGSGEQALFVVGSPLGALTYEPGRGLAVGASGLRLGGYANLVLARDEGEAARFTLDELSFLAVYDPHPRVHLFTELELEDLWDLASDREGSVEHASFEIERAYGDFTISDELNLRLGKFLTPVGRWNVIHAAPLTWTTSRPLVTTRPFDDNTTGAQVFGSFAVEPATVTYHLFGQFTDGLDHAHQPVEQERSGGARLELDLAEGPQLGATFLTFRTRGRWEELGGLDAMWSFARTELHGEVVLADGEGAEGGGWGGFAQIVQELVPRWFAVGRYEMFDPRGGRRPVHLFDVGAAYRPWPPLVLKAEYLFADHASTIVDPGFLSSVSLLF